MHGFISSSEVDAALIRGNPHPNRLGFSLNFRQESVSFCAQGNSCLYMKFYYYSLLSIHTKSSPSDDQFSSRFAARYGILLRWTDHRQQARIDAGSGSSRRSWAFR